MPLPPLTYGVPEGLTLEPGQAVSVRVRNKQISGFVTEVLTELPAGIQFKIRALKGITEEFPSLSAETRKMLTWAADYYHYPAGEVLRTFLPPNPAPPQAIRFRLSSGGRARAD